MDMSIYVRSPNKGRIFKLLSPWPDDDVHMYFMVQNSRGNPETDP